MFRSRHACLRRLKVCTVGRGADVQMIARSSSPLSGAASYCPHPKLGMLNRCDSAWISRAVVGALHISRCSE